jgi:hypothetical protein
VRHDSLNSQFDEEFRDEPTGGLSENDILDLQDCFLIPGVHILRLSRINEVRSLFASMAEFLGSSERIACLTMIPGIEKYRFLNLFTKLQELGVTDRYSSGFSDGVLEDYLLTAFNPDVLYIEASPALTVQPWFLLLKYLLFKFKFVLFLPIVIIRC